MASRYRCARTHSTRRLNSVLLRQRASDRITPAGILALPGFDIHARLEAPVELPLRGKAFEIGEDRGQIKVVIDANSNLILGAAVLAVDGAELVHDYIDLMNAKAPYTVIRDAVYIHPTLAEAVQSAVSKI